MRSGSNHNQIGLFQTSVAFHAAYSWAAVSDARYEKLSNRPATIAHIDVVHPYPLPQHPLIPTPISDPGAFATARNLEDR